MLTHFLGEFPDDGESAAKLPGTVYSFIFSLQYENFQPHQPSVKHSESKTGVHGGK